MTDWQSIDTHWRPRPGPPEIAKPWVWDGFRKCWYIEEPLRRAYPHDDGSFSISEDETWIEGSYENFDAAVLAFSMDPDELHTKYTRWLAKPSGHSMSVSDLQ
jgi:hypothetical protein